MKWTNEEIELLKKLYPKEKNKILLETFGRNIDDIREKARKLGIKKIGREDSWSEKDLLFLKENFENSSWYYLCKNLNRNEGAIFNKGASLGLKRGTYRWTEEKDNIIKKYYGTGDQDFLCETLNNSWQNIMARAGNIGVKRQRNISWTKDKLDILREFYPKETKTDWGKILSLLNMDSKLLPKIKSKISALKLNKFSDSEKLKSFIKENYEKMSNKEMSEILGKSVISIKSSLSKQGLRRMVDWEKYSDEELLNLLLGLSIKLNRTPLYEELTEYGLPSPQIYNRRFGEYHVVCEKIGLDICALYGRPCYSKNGDWCLSATEAKITNFLIDNNIKYKKNIPYKEIIPIKTNHITDWILEDGSIVEYFGLSEKKEYKIKMDYKIELCKQYNLNLISIYQRNTKTKDLNNIFKDYINNKYP
jgi:hypothetical protein